MDQYPRKSTFVMQSSMVEATFARDEIFIALSPPPFPTIIGFDSHFPFGGEWSRGPYLGMCPLDQNFIACMPYQKTPGGHGGGGYH
jgi:hypothetical protein